MERQFSTEFCGDGSHRTLYVGMEPGRLILPNAEDRSLCAGNHSCVVGGTIRNPTHHDVLFQTSEHIFPANQPDGATFSEFVGTLRIGDNSLGWQYNRIDGREGHLGTGLGDESCRRMDRIFARKYGQRTY